MIKPRLVLCSGATVPSDEDTSERRILELSAHGLDPTVHIRIEDLAKVFTKNLSPRLEDLLEIAAYVYSADCATSRGEEWTDNHSTESWSRDFRFVIPVRDLAFWEKSDVQSLLSTFLRFLSDDAFSFKFCALNSKGDKPSQTYLEFSEAEDWPFNGVDRVLMFSGGLDSLAGAIETACAGENLVLVTHRPMAVLASRVSDLYSKLRKKYPVKMIHIPVWVNKQKGLDHESTQRTRSFLFSALGTIVAESVRARGVRFFENGIVSLNLPIADEVLGARASRTTHPMALNLLTDFYKLVLEHDFIVDNPYIFNTKTDIVSIIANNGGSDLISSTSSCAQPGFYKSRSQWHCGTCSQCIDRRIAIIAAGQEQFDPNTDYISDVFVGAREVGYEKNMAVNYMRHSIELYRMSNEEIAAKFNLELSRASRCFEKQRDAAQQFIELHKRHGEVVYKVVKQQLAENSGRILEASYGGNCMLSIVANKEHLISSWRQYADRIIRLLTAGIPVACKSHKPEDEPHLQEICDSILTSYDEDLIREFPFMRWSSVSTKPDWSVADLWVELKYIRKKEDIRPITEAIAADITKYGDNKRHVLYVIYDPGHLVVNEGAFSAPIVARQDMLAHFIR